MKAIYTSQIRYGSKKISVERKKRKLLVNQMAHYEEGISNIQFSLVKHLIFAAYQFCNFFYFSSCLTFNISFIFRFHSHNQLSHHSQLGEFANWKYYGNCFDEKMTDIESVKIRLGTEDECFIENSQPAASKLISIPK